MKKNKFVKSISDKSITNNKKMTQDIYKKILINDTLSIHFNKVNNNLENYLVTCIKNNVEGKCSKHGYIKKDSVNLLSYSCGELVSDKAIFTIVYECLNSLPCENMELNCFVTSITKVGLKARISNEDNPYLIFIARDHNYDKENFSKVNVDDIINVRVIGHRYELNDECISIIAEFINIDNYKTSINELES